MTIDVSSRDSRLLKLIVPPRAPSYPLDSTPQATLSRTGRQAAGRATTRKRPPPRRRTVSEQFTCQPTVREISLKTQPRVRRSTIDSAASLSNRQRQRSTHGSPCRVGVRAQRFRPASQPSLRAVTASPAQGFRPVRRAWLRSQLMARTRSHQKAEGDGRRVWSNANDDDISRCITCTLAFNDSRLVTMFGTYTMPARWREAPPPTAHDVPSKGHELHHPPSNGS